MTNKPKINYTALIVGLSLMALGALLTALGALANLYVK